MRIRKAQIQDAEQIVQAEANIAATLGLLVGRPHEIPLTAYQALIVELKSTGLYVVAEQEGRVVGQGLGKQLMQHPIDWATQDPRFDKIELNVRATNQQVIALYHSLGFVEEDRLVKRIKISVTQYLDDIAMGLFV
jgi:ribosomal protein S18 acetylase RimI-like enzyme